MNRQRFIVIIIALIGMIATFLPWYRIVQVGTVSGISSSGWFTFIMFLIVVLLSLRKNMMKDMTLGITWGVGGLGLLASFVVLWRLIDVWFAKEGMFSLAGVESVLGSQVSVAYGAWIVVAAGICIPFAALIFRSPFER